MALISQMVVAKRGRRYIHLSRREYAAMVKMLLKNCQRRTELFVGE